MEWLLGRATPLRIVRPAEGELLERGACYVPAPHSHLTVGPDGRIRLLEDGFYRAHNIDALFCSLAINAGPRSIGVILSGMLKDGAFGLRALKDAGGVTLVQGPEGAAFRDVPASAILQNGSIDFVGSLSALAEKVCALVPLRTSISEERADAGSGPAVLTSISNSCRQSMHSLTQAGGCDARADLVPSGGHPRRLRAGMGAGELERPRPG